MKSVKRMKIRRFIQSALIILFIAVFMTQTLEAKATTSRSFALFGHYTQGWGFSSTSITSPGPTIVVEQGDTVNLTLTSSDGITHRFFVSYTNASTPAPGDPQSPDFSSSTINYQFNASSTVGTYTYRCFYHPGTMWGYFQVVPAGTIPEFQLLIMLTLLIAATAVFASVRKRKRRT
jgi:FtsP/CotA-like multicopper oxidase with cupredoxin domain